MSAANVNNIEWGGTKSTTKRNITLTVFGTSETLTLPVTVATKVIEVKEMLSQRLGVDTFTFKFFIKTSSSYRNLRDTDEIRSKVIVRGISSWTREKAQYPHPILIVGAGHHGLRQALSFLKEGIQDFHVVDRHKKVGGTAWIDDANATSKLQTEMGVYHLQFDETYSLPKMGTWPSAQQLLEHFHEASEQFGILPHVRFNVDVQAVCVVQNFKERPFHDPRKQHLDVTWRHADGSTHEFVEQFSAAAIFPGSLICPKRLEYKGEDVFDGQIGYGMFNEFDYSQVGGQNVAIIGFGAFAVENVRTCIENDVKKLFVVCRRKNLACPRVISWFANQSIYPAPVPMVLDAMQPMYDLMNGGRGEDPWSYYSVIASKDRSVATIRQASRFGIGDIYFLAHYYEKIEVILDSVKRLKPHQLILESGKRIEAEHVIKALGFSADPTVDRVFGVREMYGYWINANFRLWITTEFPGIDAGKFGGTSFSPGAIQTVEFESWFINYPKDLTQVLDSQMLPRRKGDSGKCTYQCDPRTGTTIVLMLASMIPGLLDRQAFFSTFIRQRQLQAHPLEAFVDECAAEWEGYCKLFKEAGDDRPLPSYPYTHKIVADLVARNDTEGEDERQRFVPGQP